MNISDKDKILLLMQYMLLQDEQLEIELHQLRDKIRYSKELYSDDVLKLYDLYRKVELWEEVRYNIYRILVHFQL